MQRQYCSRKLTVVPERYEAPSPEATDQTATRRQKHSSLTPTEDIFSHESNTRDSLPNVEKPEGGQGAKQTMKPGHIAKEDYRRKNSSTYYRTYVRTKRLLAQLLPPHGTDTAPHVARQLRQGPLCQQPAFRIKLQLQLRSAHTA